ncbi:MAG: hypothetical protein ACEQSX_07510 [Baekduiaceae bacterium]
MVFDIQQVTGRLRSLRADEWEYTCEFTVSTDGNPPEVWRDGRPWQWIGIPGSADHVGTRSLFEEIALGAVADLEQDLRHGTERSVRVTQRAPRISWTGVDQAAQSLLAGAGYRV